MLLLHVACRVCAVLACMKLLLLLCIAPSNA